jgi:hypothetical protein
VAGLVREAYFEHYWDQGARAFFLVHNLPGAAGANSLSIPLLHAMTKPITDAVIAKRRAALQALRANSCKGT